MSHVPYKFGQIVIRCQARNGKYYKVRGFVKSKEPMEIEWDLRPGSVMVHVHHKAGNRTWRAIDPRKRMAEQAQVAAFTRLCDNSVKFIRAINYDAQINDDHRRL